MTVVIKLLSFSHAGRFDSEKFPIAPLPEIVSVPLFDNVQERLPSVPLAISSSNVPAPDASKSAG